VIYLYAICPAGAAAPPRRRGLGGARLATVPCGELTVLCSRHRTLRPEPTPRQVMAHERVVEAAMERGPALPLRFGTQLAATDALPAALEPRSDELLRALERVSGRVELAVRAFPEHDEPAPAPAGRGASRGRDYLLARVARHRQAERVTDALHPPLEALAAGAVMRERPAPPALLVASYLVDERAVAAFRARAAEIADRLDGARVVVTGPLPPYSFAEER
jgi:Gas vesicle synthesis protein GvpL/GvpF